jgi:hypothetical protein
MTYLLDTNAFSDLMREHPAMDARLAAFARQTSGSEHSIVLSFSIFPPLPIEQMRQVRPGAHLPARRNPR